MERILLKEDNYLEWTDDIRNELLARLLPRSKDVEVDEIRESVATDRYANTTVWVVDSGATSRCAGMKSHNWCTTGSSLRVSTR
jgi:hypothetical protein